MKMTGLGDPMTNTRLQQCYRSASVQGCKSSNSKSGGEPDFRIPKSLEK
jgi:hypothetical protein